MRRTVGVIYITEGGHATMAYMGQRMNLSLRDVLAAAPQLPFTIKVRRTLPSDLLHCYCGDCGAALPADGGQSCGCFDNGCQ